ncbi:MAG: hypothetical protein M3Q07_06860 [Pseudobdellovibrionaceae bacterium]|nr:hypothetical protein [Pseudobdellovibrionaceae bacterium]
MEARISKFEAVQALLNSYFNRYPRVTIKALSMRTGVPYATLRRILQSEVNEIKDETVFKLLERVLHKSEQVEFIRSHYPSLVRMISPPSQIKPAIEGLSDVLRKFVYLSPHNLIIRLAMTRAGASHEAIERLTGESGLLALDEMIEQGLLEQQGNVIRAVFSEMDHDATQYQISSDAKNFVRELSSNFSLISHVCESVTPEALARIVTMSREFLKEIEEIKEGAIGSVPFFFNIVVGPYDQQDLPGTDKVKPSNRSVVLQGENQI